MIIYGKEREVLSAQKRSLAAWINNTLGETLVNADNLISKLSTGVILCKLAKRIQGKADESVINLRKAQFHLKFWDRAQRETFFARDNAELFIKWCKSLGVRDAVLFESDGLVLQTQPRTVILCLLELARLASKFGVLLPPPFHLPSAIAIEDDSDEEDLYAIPSPTFLYSGRSSRSCHHHLRLDSGCSSGPSSSSKSPSPSATLKKVSKSPSKDRKDRSTSKDKKDLVVMLERSKSDVTDKRCRKSSARGGGAGKPPTAPRASVRSPSSLVGSDTISSRMRSMCRSTSSIESSSKSSVRRSDVKGLSDSVTSLSNRRRSSDLDKRVLEVARQYLKDEEKFHRLSEGHYVFGDRSAFVRIVRGNNVVVRIGGGWDTLEHFLCTLHQDKKNHELQQHFGKRSKICSVSTV